MSYWSFGWKKTVLLRQIQILYSSCVWLVFLKSTYWLLVKTKMIMHTSKTILLCIVTSITHLYLDMKIKKPKWKELCHDSAIWFSKYIYNKEIWLIFAWFSTLILIFLDSYQPLFWFLWVESFSYYDYSTCA